MWATEDAGRRRFTAAVRHCRCSVRGSYRAEHPVRVLVREDAVGIELRSHVLEALPFGIAWGERCGRLEVPLAPVRPAAVGAHDRLDYPEVRLPRHAAVHVDRDVAGL